MTRVLVVEDDDSIRSLIVLALTDAGYSVDQAHNGRAGLDHAAQLRPDIILLDMKMPNGDGWEFARLYREQHGQHTPIIVFTALRDPAQRAAEVGAQAYVAKPFELDDLLDEVAAAAAGVGG